MNVTAEIEVRRFHALGGEVLIQAAGPGSSAAIDRAETIVREVQDRLSRFEPDSELSRLNRDPRAAVPASPLMLRFAEAVREAGEMSGGLVDAGLLDQVEAAGYVESIDPDREVLPGGPAADASGVSPSTGGWREVTVSHEGQTVRRPVGTRLDSGGIGKGLAADLAADVLGRAETWAVVCAGDLRFGGRAGIEREIEVTSPWDSGSVIATDTASAGAIATSGTTRRSWGDGHAQAHHLIDPRTGRPAKTGLVQVTAMAPDALEAEVRAKAALLSGPESAAEWLPFGGVIVGDDGEVTTFGFERVA